MRIVNWIWRETQGSKDDCDWFRSVSRVLPETLIGKSNLFLSLEEFSFHSDDRECFLNFFFLYFWSLPFICVRPVTMIHLLNVLVLLLNADHNVWSKRKICSLNLHCSGCLDLQSPFLIYIVQCMSWDLNLKKDIRMTAYVECKICSKLAPLLALTRTWCYCWDFYSFVFEVFNSIHLWEGVLILQQLYIKPFRKIFLRQFLLC